jgi:hypothetical protein
MHLKHIPILVIITCILLAQPTISFNTFQIKEQNKPIQTTDIIFSQSPRDPSDNDKNSYTSDSGTYNFKVYENFWNLTNNISQISWYGFCMKWQGFGWKSYDPQQLDIDIIFYTNYNNTPANETHSYLNANYTYTGTGILYEWFGGDLHEMILFEYTFNQPLNLSSGWVSIQSTYSPDGASFLWMNSAEGDQTAYQYQPPLTKLVDDLAYKLSDETTGGPNLECHGSLNWTQIPAGSLQNGSFTLENIGDPFSKLNWQITTYPSWGTWTFIPNQGQNLTPESGIQTITVRVFAPQQQSQQFTGTITIINTDDPTDSDTITVALSTPTPTKHTNTLLPKIKHIIQSLQNKN